MNEATKPVEVHDVDLLGCVSEAIITNTTNLDTTVKRIQEFINDANSAAAALVDFGSQIFELYVKVKEFLAFGNNSRALTPRQTELMRQVVTSYRVLHPVETPEVLTSEE